MKKVFTVLLLSIIGYTNAFGALSVDTSDKENTFGFSCYTHLIQDNYKYTSNYINNITLLDDGGFIFASYNENEITVIQDGKIEKIIDFEWSNTSYSRNFKFTKSGKDFLFIDSRENSRHVFLNAEQLGTKDFIAKLNGYIIINNEEVLIYGENTITENKSVGKIVHLKINTKKITDISIKDANALLYKHGNRNKFLENNIGYFSPKIIKEDIAEKLNEMNWVTTEKGSKNTKQYFGFNGDTFGEKYISGNNKDYAVYYIDFESTDLENRYVVYKNGKEIQRYFSVNGLVYGEKEEELFYTIETNYKKSKLVKNGKELSKEFDKINGLTINRDTQKIAFIESFYKNDRRVFTEKFKKIYICDYSEYNLSKDKKITKNQETKTLDLKAKKRTFLTRDLLNRNTSTERKKLIIAKTYLKKSLKQKKYIKQIDTLLLNLSEEKLLNLSYAINNLDDNIRDHKKYKYLFDYLDASLFEHFYKKYPGL